MKIKELIVVEGKSDVAFLSSFIEADFYPVNGSAISKSDIGFLKEANTTRGIIVLTDPDYPGLQIRNKIKEVIPDCKHAFVRKEVSIKNNKVGVAESTKEEVLKALSTVLTYNDEIKTYVLSDLLELGLTGSKDSAINREKLCNELGIGYSNTKQLLLKLNSIKISREKIKGILNVK